MRNAYGFEVDYGTFTGHPMDPRTEQDDNDPEYVKEQVAQTLLDAIDRGNPDELITVDGPVKQVTLSALITWMSEDAARLLLIACVHANKFGPANQAVERNERAARALRAFTERLASEYADDNWEAA